MPGNSFGTLFRITTYGESHGKAVGVVIDGVPSNIELKEEDIQHELDRRKPGQSEITTPRAESDTVHILSGLFQGVTTGTPLSLIIYNRDADPSAYESIHHLYRPGHADYTYRKKYGIRDYRGSGRASGRETAGRVAAGAVAKKIVRGNLLEVTAYTLRAAGIECKTIDFSVIEKNPMRAPDLEAAEQMLIKIRELSANGDSAGGVVECVISGLPPGIGEPVFEKLDAQLAKAIVSIGSVKGIEFGAGFSCSEMTGRQHNDEMDASGFLSNNAGGIIGGISTGQDVVFRAAVKPTASIRSRQKTITISDEETTVSTEGRHDPCICPRIIPVVEGMVWIVLCDLLLQQNLFGR